MSIEVELFGQLLPHAERRQTVEIDAAVEIRDVARRLGLTPSEVGLITVDGVQSELDDRVAPGCRLCFFPPMSGG